MDVLISTQTLHDILNDAGTVVLDASLHLPGADRDAAADHAASHIPGARFLELAGLKDGSSPVPNALPTAERLAARLQALGVGPNTTIVLYDDSALASSARAWFALRRHGIAARVLDGGLRKWRAEGRPLERGMAEPAPASTPPATVDRGAIVRTKADIRADLDAAAPEQIVDARDALRFTGEGPDMVHDLPGGHIPGAWNLPYTRLLNADGSYRAPAAIRAEFEAAGVQLSRPVVASCGSGTTAAVLALALELAGKNDVALYDGSWAEWGADPGTPKATGAAG